MNGLPDQHGVAPKCPACGSVIGESDDRCASCGFDWDIADDGPMPLKSRYGPDRCRRCAYSLRGIDSIVCPECGTPIIPTKDPNPERLAEWRHVRRGLDTLAACTIVTLATAFVLALEQWQVSFLTIGCMLHALFTYIAREMVRARHGTARKIRQTGVPRSGVPFWGLYAAWAAWLVLLAANCATIYGTWR